MSKIKLLSIAVIGLLVINLCMVSFLLMKRPPFHPERKPPMGQHGRPPMKEDGPKKIIAEHLHFDKQQVVDYDKLIASHLSSVKALDDSIRITKNNLYQTLISTNFEDKDLLIVRLGTFQKQIEEIHYNHFADLKELCKPNQIEDYNKLTKELARFFAPGKKDGPPPRDL